MPGESSEACANFTAVEFPEPAWPACLDAVECEGRSGDSPIEEVRRMRLWLWVAFFVVSNLLGVEVFRAAVTLPWEEALLPGLLTVPLVGLTALGATRILATWQGPDE